MAERSAEATGSLDTAAEPSTSPVGGPTPAEPGLPRLLTDRYRLERLIAKGGMGRVYLATQLPLGRKVALKHLVRPVTDEDFRRRFFLEASVLSRLSHPNIVVVHDYGEAPDGSLFMAMEHLDGATLLETLRREGRLPAPRAVEIAAQVCRALRSAHRQGVAHRDLKPGNVMLLRDADGEGRERRRDVVKVLDFGLVKVFQDDRDDSAEQDITRSEVMLGSPRYMAPEQIQCAAVDNRADVYSMGVVLFAMLTGRPPFVGTTLEILNQHLEAKVPSLNTLTQDLKGFNAVDPDIEPQLNAIIARCMAKSPAERYPAMDELIADLAATYRLLHDDALDTPSIFDISLSSAPPGTTAAPRLSLASTDAATQGRPDLAPAAEPPSLPAPVAAAPAMGPAPGRGARVAALVGLAALLLAAAGVAVFGPWGHREPGPAAVPAPARAPGPAPAAAAAAAPVSTRVSFASTPAGAAVSRDGEAIGVTPFEAALDPSDGTRFEFRLEGYAPYAVTAAIGGEALALHAPLAALPASPPRPAAPGTVAVPAAPGAPSGSGASASTRTRAQPRADAVLRPANDGPAPPPRPDVPDAARPPRPAESPVAPALPERPRFVVEEPSGTVPIVD